MIPGNYTNTYYGLSTDTKPTDDNVPNASLFYEMDTVKVFFYDKKNKTWREQ
jgi:hypothetical protein